MDSAKSDKEKAADEAIKGETGNVDKLSSKKQTDEMASLKTAEDELAPQETDEQSIVKNEETSVQPTVDTQEADEQSTVKGEETSVQSTALDDHLPNIQLDRWVRLTLLVARYIQ